MTPCEICGTTVDEHVAVCERCSTAQTIELDDATVEGRVENSATSLSNDTVTQTISVTGTEVHGGVSNELTAQSDGQIGSEGSDNRDQGWRRRLEEAVTSLERLLAVGPGDLSELYQSLVSMSEALRRTGSPLSEFIERFLSDRRDPETDEFVDTDLTDTERSKLERLCQRVRSRHLGGIECE